MLKNLEKSADISIDLSGILNGMNKIESFDRILRIPDGVFEKI